MKHKASNDTVGRTPRERSLATHTRTRWGSRRRCQLATETSSTSNVSTEFGGILHDRASRSEVQRDRM